jgi:predicted GNAT superfamily acetyltransferase
MVGALALTITIRLLASHEEYRALEQLQRDVWHIADVEIVPDHLLLTVQRHGGVVLGAFERSDPTNSERLVGFVFGFPGLSEDGTLQHCSHMAGVAPACQNQSVGYRLKLAQREHVLAQGMQLITWTFDPLESRNARLNFSKLGGLCSTYLRDLYGGMRDGLNSGLPSDRFRVDWHLASSRVVAKLDSQSDSLSAKKLLAAGLPRLDRLASPRLPGAKTQIPTSDRFLVRVPADFQAIKAADMKLALAWRLHTRSIFEEAFAHSYQVTELLFEGRRTYYLLQRHQA